MALTVDGNYPFGTGPSRVTPGPVVRGMADKVLPGVRGIRRLVLGGDCRKLIQEGTLIETRATAAAALTALVKLRDAIDGVGGAVVPLSDGEHTLVDEDGATYDHVVLDVLELRDHHLVFAQGGDFVAMQRYTAVWTQLQPIGALPP